MNIHSSLREPLSTIVDRVGEAASFIWLVGGIGSLDHHSMLKAPSGSYEGCKVAGGYQAPAQLGHLES